MEEDGLRSNDNIVEARPSTLQVRGATAFDFTLNTILRPPPCISVVHSYVPATSNYIEDLLQRGLFAILRKMKSNFPKWEFVRH